MCFQKVLSVYSISEASLSSTVNFRRTVMASNSKGKALVRPEGAGDEAGVHASSKKSAAEAAAALIPVSKVKCEYDCSDTRFLIENSSNFKRSGPPVRLMGYVDESWDDFPVQVVNSVRKGFVEGMPVVEVGIGGVRYLFDLYRMLHVDLESGSWRSIAWIDVHGKCFFPKTFVGAPEGVRNVTGERRIEVVGVSKSPDVEILNVNAANDLANSEILKIEIGIKIADNWDFSKNKRVCVEIGPEEDEKLITEGHSANENFLGVKRLRIATNDVEVESPKWPRAKKLVEGARAYNRVRNLFLSGIGDFEPFITITAIHQWLTGPAECARCKVFYKQTEITKASRGDAKLSYAWYGTSAKGVENVLSHGFGMPGRVPASEIHGIGIYLSALSFPLFSGRLSEDDNGEKHVILCEVILGKCEKVQAGSSQLYPSSKDFDTGVDDLKNPKWYVVWCANMNTHIVPYCVVSYRSFFSQPGFLAELVFKLGASLSSERMQEVQNLCRAYKDGKVTEETFVAQLQSVVGKQMLVSAIREISG